MCTNVSIIIPCYNEQATIHLLLNALYTQTYPSHTMEVVIADGGSTDGTRSVISGWHENHSELKIRVIENPTQTIPAALNAAIKASSNDIIIRLDAHSKPHREYIERIVAAIKEGRAQNVGGAWEIQPGGDHWIARSIAVAAGHPIGVGDARYRYSSNPAFVDTVPFGAFNRELLDQIGMFDENLLTNEDYEFNARIRQNGGKIWFDPQIRSVYYARSNLQALIRQYWRYGYWKWQMLRRYPKTIRWRQALPPLFVSSLILLILLAPFFVVAFWTLTAILLAYAFILLLAGAQLAIKRKDLMIFFGVPIAITCMHFAWGTGFLWGMIRPPKQNKG